MLRLCYIVAYNFSHDIPNVDFSVCCPRCNKYIIYTIDLACHVRLLMPRSYAHCRVSSDNPTANNPAANPVNQAFTDIWPRTRTPKSPSSDMNTLVDVPLANERNEQFNPSSKIREALQISFHNCMPCSMNDPLRQFVSVIKTCQHSPRRPNLVVISRGSTKLCFKKKTNHKSRTFFIFVFNDLFWK